MTRAFYDELSSPIGRIRLVFDDAGELRSLDFAEGQPRPLQPPPALRKPAPEAVRHALETYFAGCYATLDAIQYQMEGTDFQQRVWRELQRIPAGESSTYAELARHLGDAKLARAVGSAAGANPLLIVCPCHRLVGAGGAMTGYAGGLWRKQWLLRHEGAIVDASGNLFENA